MESVQFLFLQVLGLWLNYWHSQQSPCSYRVDMPRIQNENTSTWVSAFVEEEERGDTAGTKLWCNRAIRTRASAYGLQWKRAKHISSRRCLDFMDHSALSDKLISAARSKLSFPLHSCLSREHILPQDSQHDQQNSSDSIERDHGNWRRVKKMNLNSTIRRQNLTHHHHQWYEADEGFLNAWKYEWSSCKSLRSRFRF